MVLINRPLSACACAVHINLEIRRATVRRRTAVIRTAIRQAFRRRVRKRGSCLYFGLGDCRS